MVIPFLSIINIVLGPWILEGYLNTTPSKIPNFSLKINTTVSSNETAILNSNSTILLQKAVADSALSLN